MKAKRLLFLVMAICLASGVKAQFYDSADDIYYYVEEYHEYEDSYWTYNAFGGLDKQHFIGRIKTERPEKDNACVLIFNFDGTKAANLSGGEGNKAWEYGGQYSVVKNNITKNPSWYEDKIETTEYNIKYYSSSSSGIVYKYQKYSRLPEYTYTFSKDRKSLKLVSSKEHPTTFVYKRVDKSEFRVGRSRTPSRSLYE